MATEARADKGAARVPGLQRWELSDGRLRWRLRWRTGGEQRSVVFDAPDLRKARSHARALLESAESGFDPRPSKRRRGPLTLTSAVALWVRANRRDWKPRTRREYIAILRRHVLPSKGQPKADKRMGPRPVRSIMRPELRQLIQSIDAKGQRYEANRLLATLKSLFSWLTATNQEHLGVEMNPTTGLEKGEEKPRDITYTDEQLLVILGAGDAFLKFLCYVPTREHETRLLEWSQIDFANAVWTIPAKVRKTAVMRQVPLSTGAMRVLREQRAKFTERPWQRTRNQKAYSELATKLGFAVRPNDLRKTITSWAKVEFGPAALHGAAGHSELRLTQVYGPAPSTKQLREILEQWSARFDERAREPRDREAPKPDEESNPQPIGGMS